MANAQKSYCRFCAEPKNSDKLISIDSDTRKQQDIVAKLTFLNAIYVDVANRNNQLPKTACFICLESLDKAFCFLKSVQEAQDILQSLFNTGSHDYEDDRSGIDAYCPEAQGSLPEVKKEGVTPSHKLLQTTVEVKQEPKEEISESSITEVQVPESSPSDQNYDDDINVQDIIEAAFSNSDSNVKIYAKDSQNITKTVRKKNLKSWREYPWVCGFCDMEFLDMIALRSHSQMTHGTCSAFNCIDCFLFNYKEDFNLFLKHVRKHRKTLKKCCHYCDISLEEDEKLSTHIKSHFQGTQVACPACGDILDDDTALQQHLGDFTKQRRKPRRKRGTPITLEDLTCKLCQKVYKNLNSVRDHMRLHNTNRKRDYTCDRCGKTFYSKGTLTSHIMAHDQIRPHICRICNKSFLYPNMLRRHVQMHSGVKPFSCEQCGRCFRLQYQLNSHKIVHTDSMPYVCQYCNKAFRFKQILKNHERQHTGAKPYVCQHCGMEFTNWSNYNKHMKRRHGTDTSKKKITPEGVFPRNPETGQLIQLHDLGTEEWKTKIMIPAKRGKKKVIKTPVIKKESTDR